MLLAVHELTALHLLLLSLLHLVIVLVAAIDSSAHFPADSQPFVLFLGIAVVNLFLLIRKFFSFSYLQLW